MADFLVRSLRGGMNNTDPAISLSDDQCTLAQNVEWTTSMLGERRKGCSAVTLPADLSGKDRISFAFRHVPGTDETAAELWLMGVTDSGSVVKLAYKTSSWTTVTPTDAITVSGTYQYEVQAQSLHGKMFIAYKSAVDRLHVWDGTTLRRCGMKAPTAAPTAADTGAGTFSGTRYYRVRFTVQSGGATIRRSEPSDVLTKAPSGSGTGLVVTKPATTSEDETHWELEASLDNVNFYVLATTVVGTTTVTDSTDRTTGYATSYELSEDIEDYATIRSARYLVADEDRLVYGGSFEDSAYASTVGWTPVNNADGVGNDERFETDTDPELDLDGLEGGPLTGLAKPVTGSIWAFKFSHIYKLLRRNQRDKAYESVVITKSRGALHGSVVEGVDQAGRPCLYFLDPRVGPCFIGVGGVQWCGADILESWKTVNLDATKVVCTAIFYPTNRQVTWTIAVDGSNVPSYSLVLHTNLMRSGDDGLRKGWAVWTGTRAAALCTCLFSTNIESSTTRNRTLVPFIGVEGGSLFLMTDTGTADAGTAYSARIVTKPFMPGGLLHKFGVMAAFLMAKAASGITVTVKLLRDFSLETLDSTSEISLTATASETQVIKQLDNASFSELRTVQVEFVDPATPLGRWELNSFAIKSRGEQTS